MARPFADTLFSPAALSRFLLTAGVGLSLDLWTKALAVEKLVRDPLAEQLRTPYDNSPPVYVLIKGWLQFEYVSNPGAVFGFAPGRRLMFLLVSAAAILFLVYLFLGSRRSPFYQVILGLLMAGVVGNLYDRLRFRYVRDMIHALPGWKWPAGLHNTLDFLPADVFPYIFNVADSLLCTGVALMLIYSFFNAPEDGKKLKREDGGSTVEKTA